MLILAGFEEGEIEKLAKMYEVVPVSEENLSWLVERIVEERPNNENYTRIDCPRIVIMHGIPKEKIGEVMRAVRREIGRHVIFATTTLTSLKWTLSNLISELEEEDAFFRGKR